MLIKAAINGGRTRDEHAGVPVSPAEQAADVIECLRAGASAIHLHIRATAGSTSASASIDSRSNSYQSSRQDEHPIGAAPTGTPLVCAPSGDVRPRGDHAHIAGKPEKESLCADDVERTLLAVRATSDASVGVSTGAWILPNTAARFEAVAAWEVLPDFASVNFIEDGAAELASLLLSRGIGVEAGLSDPDAAAAFVKSGLAARCVRILLEPQEQDMEHALEVVNSIEKVLQAGLAEFPDLPPLLLHGTEATAWPMLSEAIRRGYDIRIGLEDTLALPDGTIAKDNAELVIAARRRVGASK